MELQLLIFTHCPAATLYQLMQTSRRFRTLAGRIFWGDPDTYYSVDPHWLFQGGYPGYGAHDPSFTAFVQNVEIQWKPVYSTAEERAMKENNVCGITEEKAHQFWEKFQIRLPRAKRLIVNDCSDLLLCEQHEKDSVSCDVRTIMETCPAGIEIRAFVLRNMSPPRSSDQRATVYRDRWRRVIYQLQDDGGWKILTPSDPKHKTVLMPPKDFQGPFGEYYGLEYEYKKLHGEALGVGAIATAALDRHHFSNESPQPLGCTWEDCIEPPFEMPGQYVRHMVEAHRAGALMESGLRFPDPLSSTLLERGRDIRQKTKMWWEKQRKLIDTWKYAKCKERRKLVRAFLYQMDNDELWSTGVSAKHWGLENRLRAMMTTESGVTTLLDFTGTV